MKDLVASAGQDAQAIRSFLRFLEFEKRCSRHTLSAYRRDLDGFMTYCLRIHRISSPEACNPFHLRGWVVHLVEAGNAAASVNRKIATLRSLFKFLFARTLIKSNPAKKLRNLKQSRRLAAFVPEKDMEAPGPTQNQQLSPSEHIDELIVEILYATGMRLSELIRLRVQDVDIPGSRIKVLGKGSKERIIPVGASLLQLLATHYREQKINVIVNKNRTLLVTRNQRPLYPMYVQRAVRRHLNRITTLEKKSPHIIRHTYATHLLNQGADINAVKMLLGHQSLASTQIYTHNSIGKLKDSHSRAHPKA